jgi:predicted phage terminase large subunit-like protein
VLCLPLRFDPNHPHRWPRDPRTTPGELLSPQRLPEAAVQRLERTLGPHRAAAQLQQRPVPAGGGVFKAEWFRRWTELPPGGTWTLSVDAAFKATSDSSFVVIQVWYQQGANFYLVDQRRERLDFTGTVDAIRAMALKYPKAVRKLVEAKANGPAVVSTLKRELPGFVEVEPEGGKEARANAAQPAVAGGNVFIPHVTEARYDDGRVGAPWVEGHRESFLFEATTFPKADHDDQVDAMTQFLNYAAPNLAARMAAAMANVFKKG